MAHIRLFFYNIGVLMEVMTMKKLWNFRFEICIAISGVLLLGSVIFPDVMPSGFYVCLLIAFLISIVMLKLTNMNERLKEKINRGGFL